MSRTVKAVAALVLVGAIGTSLWWWKAQREPPVSVEHPALEGAAVVWAVDDGHRIESARGKLPAMSGEDNAIWKPGEPVRLFGLRGETLGVQIVVSAGEEPLSEVTVELADLKEVSVERFVVHELHMSRRSGGEDPLRSLGWTPSAVPPGPAAGSTIADPLIPIEHAPSWADYPMTVPARRHRVVWFDLTLDGAGSQRGRFIARHGNEVLGELPIELEVAQDRMPYRALKTMVFFEPDNVVERVGDAKVTERMHQLLHRHHLSAIFPLARGEDAQAHSAALDGSLFDERHGYRGPGMGVAADVVAIGAYGILGEPNEKSLGAVKAIVDRLASLGIEDEPGERDVFLYAVDEQCDSPRGRDWRRALDASDDDRLKRLRVGHTCSRAPAKQSVDLVMMAGGLYPPNLDKGGKRVWIYNGELPRTGAFMTDSWPLSLRANAWIQAHHRIERWFYWESAFWNDGNRGGKGPYDPLERAETFHNADGDYCNGDGVLIYPGHQGGGFRDLGFPGVLPSMRLKQWRRGIQDGGYIALAREVDEEATDRIVAPLVADAFAAQDTPRWPTRSAPWFSARKKLFDLIRSR